MIIQRNRKHFVGSSHIRSRFARTILKKTAGTHFAQQMTLAFSDPGTRVFDRKVASWIFTDLTGRGQSRVRSGDRVNSNVIATEFVVLMLAAA